jgi:hypothetical protein
MSFLLRRRLSDLEFFQEKVFEGELLPEEWEIGGDGSLNTGEGAITTEGPMSCSGLDANGGDIVGCAAHVNPGTATPQQICEALIAVGLMRSS